MINLNEVNAIYSTLVKELGFPIKPSDIGAQKIDSTMLDTYRILVVAFLMTDKANQVKFFEETLLIANVSLEIVFGIFFLILSGADVDFLDWKLW